MFYSVNIDIIDIPIAQMKPRRGIMFSQVKMSAIFLPSHSLLASLFPSSQLEI